MLLLGELLKEIILFSFYIFSKFKMLPHKKVLYRLRKGRCAVKCSVLQDAQDGAKSSSGKVRQIVTVCD